MRGCAMNEANQTMMDRIWWDLSNIEAKEGSKIAEQHIKNGYLQRIWRMFANE